jgi:peptide/nickel transport system substrate-binding protein
VRLKRPTPRIGVALAALALAVGASGCGASAEGGGTLRVAYASFPDALDPALAFSAEGFTAMYDTYVPLLTYAHADGAAGSRVIPGLARSLSKVSADGRAYTLFLRKGVKYSDGTGSRTTRTPTTSSSRCSRAKASFRPATPTGPGSTTRS